MNGPDIQRLLDDVEFSEALMEEEKIPWDNLKAVIQHVLGINPTEQWNALVEKMLKSFSHLSVEMSIKLHFLHQHQDQFEMLVPSESDEHGERFHQVTAQLEYWYSGKRINSLLANLCWTLLTKDADEEED